MRDDCVGHHQVVEDTRRDPGGVQDDPAGPVPPQDFQPASRARLLIEEGHEVGDPPRLIRHEELIMLRGDDPAPRGGNQPGRLEVRQDDVARANSRKQTVERTPQSHQFCRLAQERSQVGSSEMRAGCYADELGDQARDEDQGHHGLHDGGEQRPGVTPDHRPDPPRPRRGAQQARLVTEDGGR